MPSLGWQELIIVLIIVVIIFGAGKLPEIGGAMGKSIKEFKKEAEEPIPLGAMDVGDHRRVHRCRPSPRASTPLRFARTRSSLPIISIAWGSDPVDSTGPLWFSANIQVCLMPLHYARARTAPR